MKGPRALLIVTSVVGVAAAAGIAFFLVHQVSPGTANSLLIIFGALLA